ncbi:MAG TPA: efflux RND transporter periplasmic adaptor subunit [Anaeromyxobacteraceae bacterium]|nr:efflux RND transporter periplasmic adaptor subunit [Anaeromyxobacteraceae bacterium]
MTVSKVEVRDVAVEVRAPVDLRPIALADVGAKTVGYLDAVLVDRGDRVRKGQLVALVRPSDLPDQLAAARGVLLQAEAAAVLARANKERAERLAPSGVVSQQELQSNVTAAAAAEASLAAAQANVSALAVRLGEMRIESPLDGVVSDRKLDPGPLVGPTTGTGAILTVERIDELRFFISVNEREVAGLKVGQDAYVELDAFAGHRYGGKVVRISPAFDPVTRTLDAEVHLKNPGELRSGMYGRAAIVTAVHKDAMVVQAASVQVSNGEYVVFVARGDKVKRARLEVGVDGGTWLEVLSGLSPGDEVVTAGADVLSDGATVRIARDVDPYSGVVSAKPEGGASRP